MKEGRRRKLEDKKRTEEVRGKSRNINIWVKKKLEGKELRRGNKGTNQWAQRKLDDKSAGRKKLR